MGLLEDTCGPSDGFGLEGKVPLESPSTDAVERFAAIPLAVDPQRPRQELRGLLAADSWKGHPVAALRDGSVGQARRICFCADRIELEVLAERTHEGWQFVGRIYESGKVSSQYVLRIGQKRLLPKAQGFFHWSSKHAPRTFTLDSPEMRLRFEGLSWK